MSQGDDKTPSSRGQAYRGDSSADATDASVLRSVLETTLSGGTNRLTEEELAALHAVAAEYGPQAPPLSQVAELLVAAFLKARFGLAKNQSGHVSDTATPSESRNLMSKSIAATLCSDPTSIKRLTQLWTILQESPR